MSRNPRGYEQTQLTQELADEAAVHPRLVARVLRALRGKVEDVRLTRTPLVLPGLGRFVAIVRKARRVKDPVVGNWHEVPSRVGIKFRPNEKLRGTKRSGTRGQP